MTDDKVKTKSIDDETKFYEKIANTPLPEEQRWLEEVVPKHELPSHEKNTSEMEISELSSEHHKLQQDVCSFEKKIQKLFGENFDYCKVVFSSTTTYIYIDEIHKNNISFLNTLSFDWEITSSELESYKLQIRIYNGD